MIRSWSSIAWNLAKPNDGDVGNSWLGMTTESRMTGIRSAAVLGVALLIWVAYSGVRDLPGVCIGAPRAYHELRGQSLTRGDAASRRLTIVDRIAVYEADQRCGRPAAMSLEILIADRDSSLVDELIRTLGEVRTARDTTVLLELLAYAKCERNFPAVIDAATTRNLGHCRSPSDTAHVVHSQR